ncbi:MliC family protein [Pseudooceanicola sp. LIPI14-2-Ac024]|uniref:MliC family protein n=1 Tax=Pseudooceanicola sp. LIPI14-2-Ac024 TaxID=3344875 RepID=UPI0035CEA05A
MTRTIALAAVATLASGGALLAQDGPSFDCARAESSAEKMVCEDAGLAALDQVVATRYQAALDVARGLDAGADKAEADLKAFQRGWIGGRDDCWKADDPRACIQFSYERREAELVTQFMLKEPTNVVTWTCDTNAEITTYYYDTTLPSVRIEYGDSILTGTLSPTGSGARYDTDFGGYIWEHQGELTFRTPDPDGQEMTCTPA